MSNIKNSLSSLKLYTFYYIQEEFDKSLNYYINVNLRCFFQKYLEKDIFYFQSNIEQFQHDLAYKPSSKH